MRKILAVLLVAIMAVTAAGCSQGEPSSSIGESQVKSESSKSEASQAESSGNDGEREEDYVVATQSTNLLTGRDTLSEGAYGKRPIALSINNIEDSWPQYGISDADMIFEIPVEYNITRLMALYGDYTKVPDVCSIRSCRYYYPILAEGMDAAYFHSGMDEVHARGILDGLGITTYDTTPGELFERDQDRLDEGYALEHTMKFIGSKLPEAAVDNDIRTDLKDGYKTTAFKFAKTETVPTGESCDKLRVTFGEDYYSDFTFDSASKTYLKDHSGTPHMDVATDKQLAFTNLLILETSIQIFDGDESGRKEIDIYGDHYKGYYVSGGKVQNITWSKPDASAQLKIYGEDGQEILINQGKTYISISTPDSATFGETE